MAVVGVDPGLGGAICVRIGARVHVYDVPTVLRKVGRTNKRRLDHKELARIARHLEQLGVELAVVEQVNGFSRRKPPRKTKVARKTETDSGGQSASAAFAFGDVTGALVQALWCAGIEVRRVPALVWKRGAGLVGKDKNASRRAAIAAFPQDAHLFARVKDDGRAEAALLTDYARQLLKAGTAS